MTDNEVMKFLFAVINSGYAEYGMTAPDEVLQTYQPKTHGTSDLAIVYVHRISSDRYGSQTTRTTWDELELEHSETENQVIQRVFQVGAEVIAENPTSATLQAYDYIENTSIILNSQFARTQLLADGIQIQRITDIRNIYVENERGRNQQEASFDFTINYNQSVTRVIPSVETIEGTIQRV